MTTEPTQTGPSRLRLGPGEWIAAAAFAVTVIASLAGFWTQLDRTVRGEQRHDTEIQVLQDKSNDVAGDIREIKADQRGLKEGFSGLRDDIREMIRKRP